MDTGDNTAVFDFGDLSDNVIEHAPEERYADPEPVIHRAPPRKHSGRAAHELLLFLGSACVLVMVILTLLGQVRLTALGDRAVILSGEISRMEEADRRQMAAEVTSPGTDREVSREISPAAVDHAEVLHARAGARIMAGWRTVVDIFESYSP